MTSRFTTSTWVGLSGCLLVTFATAAVGAAASLDAASFYGQLNRPAWAPPAGVFGPVWSVLYTMMGVAAWLVWRTADARRRSALVWYGLQLVANALWSWLFFGWRLGALAAGEVLLLWALIVVTALAFRRLSGVAALLLLPYLLWVSFAAVLTWSVWQRNPGLL